MEQIERVMNKLYEDNVLGNIEQSRYELLSRKYVEEYYSLKEEKEKMNTYPNLKIPTKSKELYKTCRKLFSL